MSDSAQLLVVDDHPLFREALITAVGLAYPSSRCTEACSLEEAIALLECEANFDIALLDLDLPGVSGFDGLLKLRSQYPRLPVLVVSGLENEQIIDEAIAYGAAGFLPKSLGREVLATAIQAVLDGEVYVPAGQPGEVKPSGGSASGELVSRLGSLTPQQLRVLFMLKKGLLNKQIAYELDVGATTVKKHVSEILRKLQVHSRTQAVIEASKLDRDELFDMEKRFIQEH